MKKKYYQTPVAEIELFTIKDIVTTSTQDQYDDEDDLDATTVRTNSNEF